MKKKELTYNEAKKELESIISELENETIDIDELTQQIKKAAELIGFCKNKLRKTDDEIKKIVENL